MIRFYSKGIYNGLKVSRLTNNKPYVISQINPMGKYVTSKPDVLFGTPCIAGTRTPIAVILYRVSEGNSLEDIHADYPWIPLATLQGAVAEVGQILEARPQQHA